MPCYISAFEPVQSGREILPHRGPLARGLIIAHSFLTESGILARACRRCTSGANNDRPPGACDRVAALDHAADHRAGGGGQEGEVVRRDNYNFQPSRYSCFNQLLASSELGKRRFGPSHSSRLVINSSRI